MTKCVFCVLCLFVFFFKVFKKCMSLCDFVVSPHRDCIRHPMCFCVFAGFFYEKHKNTMTKFFLSFFSTKRLHQRANVFLWVFFYEKHKNTLAKFYFVFFSAIELHQRANVFLFFCVFFTKNTKIQ